MKTKLLILSLLLIAAGLWAQNTTTNRDEMLRRALRRSYTNGANDASDATVRAPRVVSAMTNDMPMAAPSTTLAAPGAPGVPRVPGISPGIPAPGSTAPTTSAAAPEAPMIEIPAPHTPMRTNRNEISDLNKPYEGMINFAGADLNSVLQIYAGLVNRTLLRAANLSSPTIVLKTQTQLTKREAIQALDVILGLNGISIINVGDKFAKVVPTTAANVEAAPWTVTDPDDLPEMGQYVTYVVQLQYAKPSEVTQVLTPFQKMPNAAIGIDSSGIIVLRDFTENVKRMLEMIKKVDVSVPAEIISEVIPIKYALASDIAAALNSVSSGTQTTTVGASTAGGTSGSTFGGGRGGVTGSGGFNGARSTTTYGGVGTQAGTSRFGGAGNANPNFGGGGFNSGTLGNQGAQGGNFGDRLRAIINRAAGGGTGDFQILGQTKVIADERTNSLLVFATVQDLATIKSIINKLDIVLQQVLIEAIIIDVTLGKGRTLGVAVAKEPTQNGPLTSAGGMVNGSTFSSFLTGASNSISQFTGSLPQGFSYFGRLDQGWDFTLTAIENDNRVNILSRPRIQTSHAVPATLFIGQTIPYVNGTTVDINGGSRSTYEQRDVGINLSVLPLINPEGLVVMDIQEDIEQLGDSVLIDGNPVPKTIRRSASAKVAVRDGQTIVLGGFISTTKAKSKSGVPFLSTIPLLGYLFRQTVDSSDRTELAVLMHPKVLPNPETAAIAADEDVKQMPGVMRAKRDIGNAEHRAIKDEEKREYREDSNQ